MRGQEDFIVQVGKNIRNIRKLRSMTIGDVAEKIPMKEYALNRIELGYCSCNLSTLKRIADCLDVDIKIFL